MLNKLLTEQTNPASEGIDALPTEEILRVIHGQDQTIAGAVGERIPEIARAVDCIVSAMEHDGRLFYIGAGTSGRLGVLDAVECLPTFGAPPGLVRGILAGGDAALTHAAEATEDDAAAGESDLREQGFTAADVLVGIAASGRTPYVLGAVAYANRLAAATIGVSCSPDSELARSVTIAITVTVGPEVVAGSTRMKAGTATKMILNMLSTASFIRMGSVYGNLMVNVQPKNSKLVERARRIIAQAAGVSYQKASALLDRGGNDVRIAIVMAKTGLDREGARARLADARGRIRAALDAGGEPFEGKSQGKPKGKHG